MMLQVEAIRLAIARVLSERRDAVVIGSDVAQHGGPYRATSGLVAEFGVDRVLDMPRNASAIFGFARGLALSGRDVICELAPEDALRASAAIARDAERWLGQQGNFVDADYGLKPSEVQRAKAAPGAIVLRIPAFAGSDLEGALAGIPGATVSMPSRPADVFRAIVGGVAEASSLTIILEHEQLYRGHADDTSFADGASDVHAEPPPAWRTVRPGRDATIVTWGGGVGAAVAAAESLAAEGYAIGVTDVVTLSGLDDASLQQVGSATGRVIIAAATGLSFGATLAHRMTRAAFLSLEAPVVVIDVARDGMSALVEAVRDTADY